MNVGKKGNYIIKTRFNYCSAVNENDFYDIHAISIFYINVLKICIAYNKTALRTKCTDATVNMLPNRNK